MSKSKNAFKNRTHEELLLILSDHLETRPVAEGPVSSMTPEQFGEFSKRLDVWATTKRELDFAITMAVRRLSLRM